MAPTARALARQTVTADILAAARTRLTDEGPAALSLRAVARDVGMVSSAVYRYFPSRDDLLTAAGLGWYELSNWARDERAQCRHNVLYWHSDDWFGIGPGAGHLIADIVSGAEPLVDPRPYHPSRFSSSAWGKVADF